MDPRLEGHVFRQPFWGGELRDDTKRAVESQESGYANDKDREPYDFRLRGPRYANACASFISLDRDDWNREALSPRATWTVLEPPESDPDTGKTNSIDLPPFPSHFPPRLSSKFEDIVSLYQIGFYPVTKTLSSCTRVVSRVAITEWIVQLQAYQYEIQMTGMQMLFPFRLRGIDNLNSSRFIGKAWRDPWKSRKAGETALARYNLRGKRETLQHDMRHWMLGSWEAEAWRNLDAAISSLQGELDEWSAQYAQASASIGAQAVGRLTSIAAIFVPISLIAAIFSMGGEFAAGQAKFWIFWATSAGVILPACLFLFTKIPRWVASHLRLIVTLAKAMIVLLRNSYEEAKESAREDEVGNSSV